MRLINTYTGRFEEFFNADKVPRYAILSHTWDKKEQTYQEVLKIQEKYGLLSAREPQQPPGKEGEPSHAPSDTLGAVPDVSTPVFDVHTATSSSTSSPALSPIWDPEFGLSDKVRKACEVARRDGYRYIWIDSCCINKESSSELSEAINSMFNWYHDADVCYAFLVDVSPGGDVREEYSEFRESRWFKRGWTLQELVAPFALVFLSQDWQYLGSKTELAELITEITSIDIEILTHNRLLSEESVANRMRWAAQRETTRVEDQAYSLLGIFGITMSTLYGEGNNAFRRLQEQILERIPDHSIFVWGDKDARPFPVVDPKKSSPEIILRALLPDTETLLAPSLCSFCGALKSSPPRIIRPMEDSIRDLKLPLEEYTRTPYGVRTQLCLLPLAALKLNVRISPQDNVSWYLVVLRSQYNNDQQRLLCRLCYMRTDNAQVKSLYLPRKSDEVFGETAILASLFTISIHGISRIQKTLKQPNKTVYLPHPKLKPQLRVGPSADIRVVSLSLPTWTSAILQEGGYMVTLENIQASSPADHDLKSSLSFILSNEMFKIRVHYRCLKPRNRNFVAFAAQVWVLSPGEEIPEMHTRFPLSPPYTATTWATNDLWRINLPAQCLHLTMDSGDLTTLRLGLRLISQLRYDIHVDVGPSINSEHCIGEPFYLHSKELSPALPLAHKALNLILTGSARRALNSKGYSAHLVLDPSLRPSYGSHSLTLTSTGTSGVDTFSIVVKYFHAAQEFRHILNPDSDMDQLRIVTRITLEWSDTGLETVQDGPYFVRWYDQLPWKWRLEQKVVVLTTPTGALLTLQLGLDLAWKSKYYLNVDIEPATPSPTPQEMSPIWRNLRKSHNNGLENLWSWGHDSIRLTLHGDHRRALQAQGYQVRFEALHEGDQSDGRVYHRLTLSHVDITIIIEYFHDLTTRYLEPDDNVWERFNYPFFVADTGPQTHSASELSTPTARGLVPLKRCNQELTFQASVRTSPLFSVQEGPLSPDAVQNNVTAAGSTVDWNARHANYAWAWAFSLGDKAITITLPSGHRLMLRLNIYLMWFSEYCLAVEIDPAPPLPCPNPSQSNVDAPPVLDSELDATGMEDIPQLLEESTEDGQSVEVHDEPPPAGPQTRITPPGSLVEGQEGAAGGEAHDADLRSDDDPLPGGPGNIEGSHSGSAEPTIPDIADEEPLSADPRIRTTPEGSFTRNQERTEGTGDGGVHDPDSYWHDEPLPAGPSTTEGPGPHRVWSAGPEIVEGPVFEKRPQLGTEVVAQGDAEQVPMHPAQTQSGTDNDRAGARRYGAKAKIRQMAHGAWKTIQRGIRLLKGQTRL